MDVIPRDTTVEAALKEFEILRSLGPEVRLGMALEMSDTLRNIVESGVRLRHPDFDEQGIRRRVLRLMIGESLFQQIRSDTETKT